MNLSLTVNQTAEITVRLGNFRPRAAILKNGAILDLVITDEVHMVKDMTDLGPLATSDHTALKWKLVLDCRRKYNEAGMYDYARVDYAREQN